MKVKVTAEVIVRINIHCRRYGTKLGVSINPSMKLVIIEGLFPRYRLYGSLLKVSGGFFSCTELNLKAREFKRKLSSRSVMCCCQLQCTVMVN